MARSFLKIRTREVFSKRSQVDVDFDFQSQNRHCFFEHTGQIRYRDGLINNISVFSTRLTN